jgi:hypothetical protein
VLVVAVVEEEIVEVVELVVQAEEPLARQMALEMLELLTLAAVAVVLAHLGLRLLEAVVAQE